MLTFIPFGDHLVSSYVLFAVLALMISASVALPALRRVGLSRKRSVLLLSSVYIAFLVGARLWNIAITASNDGNSLAWYSLQLQGLSLYGGLFGSALTLMLLCWRWNANIWSYLDAMTLPGALAFCFARIGCFLNGCCAGRATSSALGLVFPAHILKQEAAAEFFPLLKTGYAVWPTQLFELLGAALGIPLAVILSKKLRLRVGGRFLLYAAWFSSVRLAVLPLRSLPYSPFVKFTFYPVLYLLLILVSLVVLLLRNRQTTK